jgi:hypothetical protein
MKSTRKWKNVGFSSILWLIMAYVLFATPCTLATDYIIDGDYEGTLYLLPGDTCALLPGGHVKDYPGYPLSGSIVALNGSVLNIYGGEVDGYISIGEGATSVTVYGKSFSVGGSNFSNAGNYDVFITPLDQNPPEESGVLRGPLTGFYEDDSEVNLNIECFWEIDTSSPTGVNNETITLVVSGSGNGPEEIQIDIKPGSYPNSINLGSNGVVPVAILSSDTFDANTVDPDTVELAGADVAVRGKGNKLLAHEEDVNDDGLMDLVCQVETENLDPEQLQEGYAILTGSTYDGQAIEGSDEITIVPPK